MINETLVSFKDLFKSKVRNPFFGTLATVWVIHNWDLVYSLFHFEEEWTREMRIEYLSTYFTEPGFVGNMIVCVLIAIVVLIVSYALMNVSRLVVYASNDIVKPLIQRITDKGKIVLKEDFKRMKANRDQLQKRYEAEFNARIKLLGEYDELNKRYEDVLQGQKPDIGELDKENVSVQETERLFEYLDKNGLLEDFEELVGHINNQKPLSPNDSHIISLTKLDLIKQGKHYSGGKHMYGFTERGKNLANFFMRKRLES